MRFLWAKTLDVLAVTAAGLLVVPGDCRLGSSTTQRFRAKFIAHAELVSIRFADAGLCPESQSFYYRNSEGADAHQSQPYSKSNPNSDRDSDTNAAKRCRAECLADANASACGFSATTALAPVREFLIFSGFRNYSLFNLPYQTIFVNHRLLKARLYRLANLHH